MLRADRFGGVAKRRVFGFVAAIATIALADVALGCGLPRRVFFRTDADVEEFGTVRLRGTCTAPRSSVSVRVAGLPEPEEGVYLVQLCAGEEEVELGALAVDDLGRGFLVYDVTDDLREFALEAELLKFFDGESPVAEIEIAASASIGMRGRVRFGELPRRTFDLVGRAYRRPDGSGGYDFWLRAKRAEPGEYVLRLEGEGIEPIDVPVTVNERGMGLTRTGGSDDLLLELIRVDQCSVLVDGEVVASSGDIVCR
jgi:hypothetical protein